MNESGSILIVDDERLGRETLSALLHAQGYHLMFAANGPEALATAASSPPDLVLLDVMMPEMDGFTVCQRLRTDPVLAEVPVILVTALDDRESRLQGIQAGADDFISKPFDRIELRARVQTIIRLNRYRRLLAERIQRQKAEAEMLQRIREVEFLQEADRIKNQFVSNVSHELRTPLSVLTLQIGSLQAFYSGMDDATKQTLIGDIRDQIRKLNQLVETVLDIARLDNRAYSAEQCVLNLADLIDEEVLRQQPLIDSKQLTVHADGAEHVHVIGHAELLQQVCCNLLNNAIKYTSSGGRIICEYRALTGGLPADSAWPGSEQLVAGRWAALRVCDTGIGIAAEHLPRLFERFYRVRHQNAIPGTGLGLAIAADIVALHQGQIAVASIPGEGTTFAVYMPLHQENAANGNTSFDSGSRRPTRTIV